MNDTEYKDAIAFAVQRFGSGDLADPSGGRTNRAQNAVHLLDVLGYRSDKQIDLDSNRPDAFFEVYDPAEKLNREKALSTDWNSIDLLFQLTGDELTLTNQLGWLFDPSVKRVDNTIIESYLFFALRLRGSVYNRTELSQITREINKLFPMPVMLLFLHGRTLTLSIINRRLHKRDESRDVLEKVTLIKDIDYANPHRAHIEILFDLSLEQLHKTHGVHNFVELHRAWAKTLDISELNKSFFREIANWYFWAVDQVTFPEDAGKDVEVRNATSVIRLITRLIFVWFIKEKGLVRDALFNQREIQKILTTTDPQESTYYKAILQNLFFATLNQEMNTPQKPDNRKFRGEGRQHYNITSLYRYKRYFTNPDEALQLFKAIPFLNGGLFECLDKPDKDDSKKILRIDGFSDRDDNPLYVPNFLFFSEEQDADLNEAYGTKGKRYKVRGLIDILSRYKFTITENTPIEEEVALDPELLGKVFENLLAAYNPETGATARKQTGSFYTPREIVNYMVDESLVAYLKSELIAYYESQSTFSATTPPSQLDFNGQAEPVQTLLDTQKVMLSDEQKAEVEGKLRHLIAYNEEPHRFNEDETEHLIKAIDTLKILDPACGSGAFPMGILHKLVFILGKLDPRNERWKERQIENALKFSDTTIRESAIEDIEQAFDRNELDYGRKLYLIENCIYGVDIQPVAVQIAKLRFFISLIVDQKIDETRENRGVRPLPNLETKFVAANTLIGIDEQLSLRSQEIIKKERELEEVRHRHFTARTPKTKNRYRERDAELRAEISELLNNLGLPSETTEKLAYWDPYDQNAFADFFDPEWMFGIAQGFDVVIGNPPYVRQENIRAIKPMLKVQYDCYTGTADLYVYFYERGFQLLRDGGVLTYISSNKYFRSAYGKKLRDFLARQSTVYQLIDFGDAPVFMSIAYPSIITLRKTRPGENHLRALNWEPGSSIDEFETIFRTNSFTMPQKALTTGGWRLESPAGLSLLEKLQKAGKPLGNYVNGGLYSGIKTGFNKGFIVDRVTRDRLVAEHSSSVEILKPFLRGRDVKRWRVNFAGQHFIKIESSENKQHSWSGKSQGEAEKVFAKTYPAIHAHFEKFRSELVKRYDQGKYFWELRSCGYWGQFDEPKIVYPDIAQAAEFTFDDDGYFLGNTSYLLPTKEMWLLGLLNSKAVFWFYTKTSTQIRGGFVRFIAQYVSQIPVPTIPKDNSIKSLVDQIIDAKRYDPDADVTDLEHDIDQLVYELYGLTSEEIAIVEEATRPKGD
ncbi:Eco57I restriction-modification methylase domain-containing protein [Candidatus Poribacteria bacterium]|nr:Eco57I restriction-modification methylase domain-containing protein [Candidatus Poribacteria bacterium]